MAFNHIIPGTIIYNLPTHTITIADRDIVSKVKPTLLYP